MKKYGIIGWPVEHSLSPVMHGAGFDAIDYEASYSLFPVEPGTLSEKILEMRRDGVCGWNVTVPYKQDIIPLLDVLDPVAIASESVNTVVNRDGKLYGYSTDGYGLQRAVEEAFSISMKNLNCLFVGAGGAARAAAVQFASAGASRIVLANRTISRAEYVADRIKLVAPDCKAECISLDQLSDKAIVQGVDLVIQCTSVELEPGRELQVDLSAFRPEACFMDMIYNYRTPFLKKASAIGARTATGADMLLYQGVKGFEMWTKQTAPVDVMRNALQEATNG